MAVTPCAGVSVCAVYVAEAGTNLPCTTVPQEGNVTWDASNQMGLSGVLDLGYVSNTGIVLMIFISEHI